jgi:hypothetical protein
MICDGLGPYHRGEPEVRDRWRVVLGFRWRPFWIIASVRLPNFEDLNAFSIRPDCGLFWLQALT